MARGERRCSPPAGAARRREIGWPRRRRSPTGSARARSRRRSTSLAAQGADHACPTRTAAAEALTDGARPTIGSTLTRREREVLGLLCQGASNRQIGETLFITENTAGVHVSNILGKLDVSSRTEAVAVATMAGLGLLP